MAFSSTLGLSIEGVISVLPENKEDNLNLAVIPKENREAIVNHTGIRFRHRVKSKQTDVQALFAEGVKELLNTL